MREVDSAASEFDDLCLLGRGQRGQRALGETVHDLDQGLRQRRRDGERALRRTRKRCQPIADERPKRLRQLVLRVSRLDAREFEREERISARQLVDSPEQRTRKA